MALINTGLKSEGLMDGFSFRTDQTRIMSQNDATYSMSSTSPYTNIIDGTASNYSFAMPDATTLQLGHQYYVVNDDNAIVSLRFGDKTSEILTLYPRTRTTMVLKDNTSTKGLWVYESALASGGASGYSFFGSYGGNALAGRYLEIYPGSGSDTAPYVVIGTFAISALSIGTTALNTGSVGIYKTTDLVNAIATISLSNSSAAVLTGLYVPLLTSDRIAIKVASGTLNKPYVTVYLAFAG